MARRHAPRARLTHALLFAGLAAAVVAPPAGAQKPDGAASEEVLKAGRELFARAPGARAGRGRTRGDTRGEPIHTYQIPNCQRTRSPDGRHPEAGSGPGAGPDSVWGAATDSPVTVPGRSPPHRRALR